MNFEIPSTVSQCCRGSGMVYKQYLYLTEQDWHGVVRMNLDTDPLLVEPVAGDGGAGIADSCAHVPDCLLALVCGSF
jgi:hypothetical protein